MTPNPTDDLDNNDLSAIRDAVPALDLLAIRSLRRAGFQIVRQNNEADKVDDQAQTRNPDWVMNKRSSSSAA